jgi:flagellar basal body-associated protein FliL
VSTINIDSALICKEKCTTGILLILISILVVILVVAVVSISSSNNGSSSNSSKNLKQFHYRPGVAQRVPGS